MLEIPVRDDATEFPGQDRASMLLDLLEQHGISVASQNVIDLGAGMGFMSLGSARWGANSVTAYDVDQTRLDEIANRSARVGLTIATRQLNLLDGPPVCDSADIAFIIGVVEYAGLWDTNRSVESLQIQVLRTAHDMLRPGGTLVFATKNRLWPKFVLSEVHTGKPLVAVLPRSLADRFNRRLTGEPYRHHIHSSSGWKRLLEAAGFSTIRPLVPYFGYQFPIALVEHPRRSDQEQIDSILTSRPELQTFAGRAWKPKLLLTSTAQYFHCTVSQSLIFIAKK